jgi:hypothetical protein
MRAAAAPWKNDKGGASLNLGDFEVASVTRLCYLMIFDDVQCCLRVFDVFWK